MSFSIFPKTVYKGHSKISGEILVKEQLGQLTLEVDKFIQSGGIVKSIWKKALAQISNFQLPISNVLILGVGGGTAVHLVKVRWPGAKITAVEIDPKIIEIGRQYFRLGKSVENGSLKIITADVFKWIESCPSDLNHENKKFGLIIVDLYLGKKFPTQAESEKFLEDIKKLLTPNGIAVFNRLKIDNKETFEKRIRKIFPKIDIVKTSTNNFYLASFRKED